MNTKPPLVVIAGPTASGKSALALALSRLTPSVIVNADASQVYRDLRVVTARPGPEEERETPHRLFGHVDGAIAWSAAAWAREAAIAVAEAHAEGRLPILVGGTGMYIRTLLDGIAPVPDIDPDIRAAVRAMPLAEAYEALRIADPTAAGRLSPSDTSRVARALEVMRSTGRPLSDWQKEREGGIGASLNVTGIVLLPPRDWLHARCDARFETIFEDGQDEVATLIARKLDPALPVMRAIGVRDIADLQDGIITQDDAMTSGKLGTRQYAKRQYTWFKRQLPAGWDSATETLDAIRTPQLATKLRNLTLTG